MADWYAVHTHPSGERKALVNLQRQGFEAYLPRYLKRRRHARKVDWVESPLFPRYLFVRLDLEQDRWLAVRSTFGVSHLVSQGERPLAVPPDVIEAIQAREDEAGLVRLDTDRLRKGDRVRLTDGAMAEVEGLFEGYTDQERVVVLLDLLGRQVRVKASRGSVAACA